MKISAITNGISQDYEKACQIMNKTGVKYAEIQHVNNTPIENLTVEDAKKFKKLSDKYGIVPVCVTTHAFMGMHVASVIIGDENYKKHMALLKNGIAIAKVLGVKQVRSMAFTKTPVTFGYHGADNWAASNNANWGRFLKLFEPIAQLGEDEDMDILVETCFNSMNTSAYLTKKMINDLGAKRIKFLWDPANALVYNEEPTVEVYESIKDILNHIHIKDLKANTVTSEVDFRPIGRGMLAPYLMDLAAALRKDNYQGCVSLENAYRPDVGDYVDGYYTDIVELKKIFE